MAWFELHQEFAQHPKIARMAKVLGITRIEAKGHIITLWCWAISYCQDGDVGKFSPEEIAYAGEWDRDPALFVDGLKRSGFINSDDSIHDWDEYMLHFYAADERRERLKEQTRERVRRFREKGVLASDRLDCNAAVTLGSNACNASTNQPNQPTIQTNQPEATDAAADPPAVVVPVVESGTTFDQHLIECWGKDGRVSNLVREEFIALAKRNGWGAVFRAVREAAYHNAKSIAYVRGILEPKTGKSGGTVRAGDSRGGREIITPNKIDELASAAERIHEGRRARDRPGGRGG